MTPTITISKSQTNRAHLAQAGQRATVSVRPPFSRASHFALILVPVMLGVGFSFTQDTGATAGLWALATFLFTLGLGGALLLLLGVEKVEEWEARN